MFKNEKNKNLACFFQAVFFREKKTFFFFSQRKKQACFFQVATLHPALSTHVVPASKVVDLFIAYLSWDRAIFPSPSLSLSQGQ